MQDDVSDGVHWAVKEGIADPKRVCIVGGSYGSYAAMWGTAKDPDLYRCAISINGVANLRREVNDFGGMMRERLYRGQWLKMTPDFAAVSPINAIARIKAPLLLIHGKKDVTVDHGQSARMYSAMTRAGKTVEFVSVPLADRVTAGDLVWHRSFGRPLNTVVSRRAGCSPTSRSLRRSNRPRRAHPAGIYQSTHRRD